MMRRINDYQGSFHHEDSINAQSEEQELGQDIEYSERCLATAKSRIPYINSQKQRLYKFSNDNTESSFFYSINDEQDVSRSSSHVIHLILYP